MKSLLILFLIGFVAGSVCLLFVFLSYKKRTDKELKEKQAEIDSQNHRSETYTKGQKENEELVEKMLSGSNLDSFDATIELLQKSSEKGRRRNS